MNHRVFQGVTADALRYGNCSMATMFDTDPILLQALERTCKVMVVDDDFTSAQAVAEALCLLGSNACAVEGGLQAIELMQRESFDVVVVDIEMPDVDGYGVVRWARECLPSPPKFIALTGLNKRADRTNSTARGLHHHVAKPIDPIILQNMIERIAFVADSTGKSQDGMAGPTLAMPQGAGLAEPMAKQ